MAMASWIAKIKGSMTELNNLEDLFFMQVNELRDVEDQIMDVLPRMAQAASSPMLKEAFRAHVRETQIQKERLDEIFRRLNREPESVRCEGIKGILDDGELLISARGDPNVKDAALVAAAQQVEHYEMACYGSARTFAQFLGWDDIAVILQQTLDEEKNTDAKLTEVALNSVNVRAA